MLEQYFGRPSTVDRVRASWIAAPVEQYVAWMRERGYAACMVRNRVPILVAFGEFAAREGARTWEELPDHVAAFVRLRERIRRPLLRPRAPHHGGSYVEELRRPIEQMLQCILPGYQSAVARPALPAPFAAQAPGFFAHLRQERGLREATIVHYLHHLRRLERHLGRAGRPDLRRLSPKRLREFLEDASRDLAPHRLGGLCDCVRVFLRYLYREQILPRDLTDAIERPRQYRFAHVPRSIPWEATERLLGGVDRRSGVGRRDFALLLLLVTYGLRAREIAALTLDDVDWRGALLRISQRKGGHSSQYRLTPAVGDALVEYIERARPQTAERRLFLGVSAPRRALSHHAISQRVAHWLKKADIDVPRAGSHTLRHTVVQRLLDHGVPLQQIGDYVGHRSPDSTQVYTKIDLRHLREIATGYGEEVLG